MSKEKPEVGDVWLFDNVKWNIIEQREYCTSVYGITDIKNGPSKIGVISKNLLIEHGKYLSKSKVNIKELCDVAED